MKRVVLFVTPLALLLSTTNWIYGQEPSDEGVTARPAAASASEVTGRSVRTTPLRAQLLLIKSDWSQGDNAKAIEADWREALKGVLAPQGVRVSQELLDRLPAPGPEILFAPDLVKFYKIEHFQQLHRWLRQHELVENVILFPEAELLLQPSVRDKTRANKIGFPAEEYTATVSKRMDFIPLPRNPRATDEASGEPYAQIYWDIVLSKESGRLAIVRQPVVTRQKLEHGGTSSGAHGGLCSVARYVLPKGHAAITQAFPASAESEFRDAARQAGIEPLIVVFDPSPTEHLREAIRNRDSFLQSRFCWPDQVETVSVQHGHEANLLGPRMLPGRVPPGLTRDPNPPSSATLSEQTPGTKEVRVFRLKNADANSLATTLTQLFREDIAIVADGRDNTLIVRGTGSHISEAANLVEQIDVNDAMDSNRDPAEAESEGAEEALAAFERNLEALGTLDSLLPTSPAMIEELRWIYESNERLAGETAAELRRLGGSKTDAARRAALGRKLRQQVAETFTVRQQLHEAELANVLWKLKEAQETVNQRNRIRDQIIDRRVQDLVNPERGWDIGQDSTQPSTTQLAGRPQGKPEPPLGSRSSQERISILRELAGENVLIQPLILYFRADWCSPCRKLDQEIQKLREEGVTIFDIDLGRQRKTASAFQVDKIPTLVLCVGGTEVDRAIGTAIESLVQKYCGELSKSPLAAEADELKRLQGVCRMTRMISETPPPEDFRISQIQIEDNFLSMRGIEGNELFPKAQLRLDPSRTPKQVDIFYEGEESSSTLGIYALEEESGASPKRRLRIAFGTPRPASFASDGKFTYWELERTDERAEPSISKLEGDWQLESIVGRVIIRHLQEVKARVRGNVWTDVRQGHESHRHMVLDATAEPKTIDLIDEREPMRPPVIPPPPMIYRGIYDVRDDTLIIAWGRDTSVRPTGFTSKECAIHTWKRIQALELVPAAEAAAYEGAASVDSIEESAAATLDSPTLIQHPRAITVRNLARLMLAMHEYCDVHKHFPPAAVLGKDGKGTVPHSWRVELLPFLGQQELYDQYRFDEPWDSDHNKTLLAKMPALFRSPLDASDSTNTSYFGVVAKDLKPQPADEVQASKPDPIVRGGVHDRLFVPRGMCSLWPSHGSRLASSIDGTKHTIALVEARRDIPWTKPEDITYDAKEPLPKFGGWFEGGFFAGFGDGMVKFVLADNDERTIRNLLTINDGQRIEPRAIDSTLRDDPLEFRILPNRVDAGREPSLSDDEFERYRRQLAKGDFARPLHGDGHCWREIESSIRDIPFTLKEGDRSYVLTSFLDNALLWSELQGNFRIVGSTLKLPEGTSSLDIEFDDEVGDRLRRLTRANLNNRLAIVVCGKVIMAPTIRDEIGSSVKITGVFSKDELTRVLKALQGAAESDDGTGNQDAASSGQTKSNQADVSSGGPEDQPSRKSTSADLALGGYCPVTLHEKDKWLLGEPAHSMVHDGVRYNFASRESLETFKADPTRYAPVMNGRDVVIAIDESRLVPGVRQHGIWFRGRMFLFESEKTQERFMKTPEYYYEFACQQKQARSEK